MTEEQQRVGNPAIIGLGGFGFSLFVAGTVLLFAPDAHGALIFGLFMGFIDEFVAAMWLLIRKETYLATVMGLFGSWLGAVFLLYTFGVSTGLFSETSWAIFNFALLVPDTFLAIPAIKKKDWVVTAAFVFLWLLLFGLGMTALGYPFATFSGIFLYGAAAMIWWKAIEETLEL